MDAAMTSAVSALQAQSTALSNISNNLANSQTTGYKAVETQFTSLLTELAAGSTFTTGGVSASARQNLLQGGTITGTSTSTDMAINGNGMFAVTYGSAAGGQTYFTRNGAFDTDQNGNLYLSGTNYYLLGWPTDTNGNVTATNSNNIASLQLVDVNKYNSSAVATTYYSLSANFPAAAQNTLGTLNYTNTSGVSENMSMTYTLTGTSGSGTTASHTYMVSVNAANGTTVTDGTGTADQLLYSVTVDDTTGSITGVTGLSDAYTGTTLPGITPSDASAATTFDTLWATTANALGTGFTKTLSMSVYDSLGVEQSFPVTWTASGNNTWLMTVATPTNASGTSTTGSLLDSAGSVVSSYTYEVSFNSDGTLGGIKSLPTATGSAPMSSSGSPEMNAVWNDGAAPTTGTTAVTIDLGTVGKTDGLSQFATTTSTSLAIAVKSPSSNGVQYGQLTGVSVDSAGNVIASYDNGQKVPIYKIPIVTFPNENGLTEKNAGVYEQSSLSGDYTLNQAGENGAGTVTGSALEGSTVNTSVEFSNMITAQQAYSSASQVIGTDKQMFNSLLQVIQ